MSQKQARKTSRLGIFSKHEKDYLKGKIELDRIRKSEFHKKLDKRFDAILSDLDLMVRSKQLKTWRVFNSIKHSAYSNIDYIGQLSRDVQPIYSDMIRRFKKGKKIFYYVDTIPSKYVRMDERALDRKWVTRRIRSIDDESRNRLIEYYEKSFLPYSKKDAITMKEIEKISTGKMKPKSHRELTIKELENEDPEMAMNMKKIEKIVTMYRNKMNKRLQPFGFRIGKIDYIG